MTVDHNLYYNNAILRRWTTYSTSQAATTEEQGFESNFEIESKGEFICGMDGYKAMTFKAVYVLGGFIAFAKEILAAVLGDDLKLGLKYLADGFVNIFSWVGYAMSALYYISEIFEFGSTLCEVSSWIDYVVSILFRFVDFAGDCHEKDNEKALAEKEKAKDAGTSSSSTTTTT